MFGDATQRWFDDSFQSPTEVQTRGWAKIAADRHALLVAPTGSGKTLAAFLAGIDRLGGLPADASAGVRVLYVSPLKALVHDIERNLRAPLIGIDRVAGRRFASPRSRFAPAIRRSGNASSSASTRLTSWSRRRSRCT